MALLQDRLIMKDKNFKAMIPQLPANEIYKNDFIMGYHLSVLNIESDGYQITLDNFNSFYPVGLSTYFNNLTDYFYAKGQMAALLDNMEN